MNLKKIYIGVITSIIAFNLLHAVPIKIPPCIPETSLSYLAYKFGLKVVYGSFDKRKVASFVADASDVEEVISQYQSQNADFLKMDFLKEANTIICYDKKTEEAQKGYLESRLILDGDKKIYAIFPEGKMPIEIMASIDDDGNENKVRDVFAQMIAANPSTTLREAIMAVMKNDKVNACEIMTYISASDDDGDEDRQMFQALLESDDTSKGGKEFAKRMLQLIEDTSKSKTCTLTFYSNDFGREPTLDEIGIFLKNADDKLYELSSKDGASFSAVNMDFWFGRLLAFQSEEFLKYLFDKNLFNAAAPYAFEFYIDPVPSAIAEQKNYKAISLMLRNLHKIKSREMQENVIGNFVNIDKAKLSPNDLDLLLKYAKQFKIERIYVDTSKWIGDELPADYDRWQNFKVSETELAFEREKLIDKTQYHLKLFKYKEPVKIGGIPLRKVEEADYSTPEKAYFSSASERTYEWSKASVYDIANYNEDDFSLYRQWKDWHSGLDPFILLLYKVEISQSGEQKKDSPDIYFLIQLLSDDNMLAAIPMKLDGNQWKFYVSRPRHVEILGDYIQKEIAKTKPKIKDGQ